MITLFIPNFGDIRLETIYLNTLLHDLKFLDICRVTYIQMKITKTLMINPLMINPLMINPLMINPLMINPEKR